MKFDLNYLFSAKYAQWISIVLIAFFISLIIFQCSTLMFSAPAEPQLSSHDKNMPAVAQQDSFGSILKASLFGIYVPNNVNEGNVKKSMLNVTLVGILLADHIEDSQVIIRSASGQERTYELGDSIPGDAVIKRITADGVFVERHGALESLSLPKNELTFEPVAKPLKEE